MAIHQRENMQYFIIHQKYVPNTVVISRFLTDKNTVTQNLRVKSYQSANGCGRLARLAMLLPLFDVYVHWCRTEQDRSLFDMLVHWCRSEQYRSLLGVLFTGVEQNRNAPCLMC